MAAVSESLAGPVTFGCSESEKTEATAEISGNDNDIDIKCEDKDQPDEYITQPPRDKDFSRSPLKQRLHDELSSSASQHAGSTELPDNGQHIQQQNNARRFADEIRERKAQILRRKCRIAQLIAKTPDKANIPPQYNQELIKLQLDTIADFAKHALEDYTRHHIQERTRHDIAVKLFSHITDKHEQHFKLAPEERWGLLVPGFLDEKTLICHQTIFYALLFFQAMIENTHRQEQKIDERTEKTKELLKKATNKKEMAQACLDYRFTFTARTGPVAWQCEHMLRLEAITKMLTDRDSHSSPVIGGSVTQGKSFQTLSQELIQRTYQAQKTLDELTTNKTNDLRRMAKENFNRQIQNVLRPTIRQTDQYWCTQPGIGEQKLYWAHRLFICLVLESASDYPLILWRLDTITQNDEDIDLKVAATCSERIYRLSLTLHVVLSKNTSVSSDDTFVQNVKAFHFSFEKGYLQSVLKALRADTTNEFAKALKALESASTMFAAVNKRLEDIKQEAEQFTAEQLRQPPKPCGATQFKYEPEGETDPASDSEETEIIQITRITEDEEAMRTSTGSLNQLTRMMQSAERSDEVCLAQYILFSKNENISPQEQILAQLNILEKALAIALKQAANINHANRAVIRYAATLNSTGFDGAKTLSIKFTKAIRALPAYVIELDKVAYEIADSIAKLEKYNLKTAMKNVREDFKVSMKILLRQKQKLDEFLAKRNCRTCDWLQVYRLRGELIHKGVKINSLPKSLNTLLLEEVELSVSAKNELDRIAEVLQEKSGKIAAMKA